jgi:beta-glucanase (GH16 family)
MAHRYRIFIRGDASTDPAILPYWGAPLWRDEFDVADSRTPSGVNPDLWRIWDGSTLGAPRLEFLTGRPQNVYIANSCLNIVAIRETGVHALNGTLQDANHPWTSGYIDTWQKQGQKYGRWEMRFQLNTHPTGTRGIWPALWMRPATWLPTTQDGEIDWMEAYGGPWAANGDTYRLGSAGYTLWENETSTARKTSDWITPADNTPDLSNGFHTLAFEWIPTSMKTYVDGNLRRTDNIPNSTNPWLSTTPFDPYYVKIQLQVGNKYWGIPDPTHPEWNVSPTEPFKVDYIRYWPYPG